MNEEFHTAPFLIIAILATSILIFFMVVVIITYTRKAKRKEEEHLKVRMEDRERIYQYLSKELHDNITNMLTLARFGINDLEEKSNKEDYKTVKKIGAILDGVIKDTHHISRGLSTTYIATHGIIAVVTEDLEWIENSLGIHHTINVTGARKAIPDFKQLMLYRIVQEALMNSAKHSKAKNIDVNFGFGADKSFYLYISDDGIGFSPDAPDFKQGVGITSIYERARQLGGKAVIDTRLHNGTRVFFDAKKFWK